MFSLIANGKITKRILPGSESVISKTESPSFSTLESNQNDVVSDKIYVNAGLDEFEEENATYKEVINQ